MGDGGGFVDPAVFLFTNTKYHDCIVNVTDQDTNKIEKIGVASSHLISSSSVFRTLLGNNKTSLDVDNVSPAVFKLMLTHMYNGKLPAVDPVTTAQLALAASQYNLQHLVRKACKRLVPNSVDDVFPALFCVAHINNSELLPHVAKIIQEQTDAVVSKDAFMKLDLKCLQWIASQDQLAITEMELWNSLIKWAKSKAIEDENKPVREIMQPLLPYVRLATLNKDEFIAQIVPADVLLDSEVVQILKSFSIDTAVECPGLCANRTTRLFFRGCSELDIEDKSAAGESFTRCLTSVCTNALFSELGQSSTSHFKIKPKKCVILKSLTVQGAKKSKNSPSSTLYANSYNIVIKESFEHKIKHFYFENVTTCKFEEEYLLPVSEESYFFLEPVCEYEITIIFYSYVHPVCLLTNESGDEIQSIEFDDLTIICDNGPCHLRKISYDHAI